MVMTWNRVLSAFRREAETGKEIRLATLLRMVKEYPELITCGINLASVLKTEDGSWCGNETMLLNNPVTSEFEDICDFVFRVSKE